MAERVLCCGAGGVSGCEVSWVEEVAAEPSAVVEGGVKRARTLRRIAVD